MGEFCLLYLLCMLPFPVPQTLYFVTDIQRIWQLSLKAGGAAKWSAECAGKLCADRCPPGKLLQQHTELTVRLISHDHYHTVLSCASYD
jgi:hypothetical protein